MPPTETEQPRGSPHPGSIDARPVTSNEIQQEQVPRIAAGMNYDMPAVPPPGQQAHVNQIYPLSVQQQIQARFQDKRFDVDLRLRGASVLNLGPTFNFALSQRVPARPRNQDLLSMAPNYPSTMSQQRYLSEITQPQRPVARTTSTYGNGPSSSVSYSDYDHPFQQSQNRILPPLPIQPGARAKGYVNPFQGDLAQLLPQAPPVLETYRLPLLGLPKTRGLGPEPGSTSGPLNPSIYHGFPAPDIHHGLDFIDQEETQRHLAFYIDDTRQRRGERISDYKKRTMRAAMNMNLVTRRRPRMPQGLSNQEQRRWRNDFDLAQIEHRERIDPNHEAYDRGYAQAWYSYQSSRRYYNSNQRVRATDRLRRDFEAAGYPNLPDPPENEDSGDDLFTHDESGILCDSLGDATQHWKGSEPAPSARKPRLQKIELNRPPGSGGQGQVETGQISVERCDNCAKRNQKCSLKQSGKPCDRCNRLVLTCLDRYIWKRGCKPGSIRGRYNKSKSKQTKNKNARKTAKENEEYDDEDEDEDDEESNFDDAEESEDEEDMAQPRSGRKRNRASDDEQQQDERNSKRMATSSSSAQQQRRSTSQQSIRTRASQLTLSSPCASCAANGRICSSRRPCTQCLDRGERDCDGDIIDQPYRSDVRYMATPTRFNGMGASSYPTPSSGGYVDRRGQIFGSPTPGNGYAQDIGLHDDFSTRPLAPLTAHQRQFVPLATAEAVLQDQSGTWMGGRDLTRDEAARRYLERISNDANNFAIDAINGRSDNGGSVNARPAMTRTSRNAIDPALGRAENPHLPSPADLMERQAAKPIQQAGNLSHGASNTGETPTWSPVNQSIRMVRVPGVNFNNVLPCQELVPEQPQPTCGRVPTKPCDDIRHVFDVCDSCESGARMGRFNIDEVEEYALGLTQQYMCRYCADETKSKFSQDPDSGIQGNNCHCIGQLRMAWLCRVHRDDAVQGVSTKALSYNEWRARNLAYDNCPACNARKGDESTRVWVCGACGEKVVGP